MSKKQNCKACVYKDMKCPGEGHCYMFKKKPAGRCGSFEPEMPTKEKRIKQMAREALPEFEIFLR